jgi:hypothetical protein
MSMRFHFPANVPLLLHRRRVSLLLPNRVFLHPRNTTTININININIMPPKKSISTTAQKKTPGKQSTLGYVKPQTTLG